MRTIAPVLLIILTIQLSLGQKSRLISVGVSANAYRGDLTSNLEKWSNAFHIGFKLNSGNKLNGNFNLGFGFITGENLNYQFDNGETPAPRPNWFFRTPIFMINYELNYNFFKWKNFTFYASQGVGLMRFIPQDQFFEDFQTSPRQGPPMKRFPILHWSYRHNSVSLLIREQFRPKFSVWADEFAYRLSR